MASQLKSIFVSGSDQIAQNYVIESWHISQSIDAFTGIKAYDIFLSGSMSITGSFTHGAGNTVGGTYSHAEGNNTIALGSYSHAQGIGTIASGSYSHAEGSGSKAVGLYSHAEGKNNSASVDYSHAEGEATRAQGTGSHTEGSTTLTVGVFSHAEGYATSGSGDYSHAEGFATKATGYSSHSEGQFSIASGIYSHAEGANSQATGNSSHAEGGSTQATGVASHAEGNYTVASGDYSHAEGNYTVASGQYSHAEGVKATASLYSEWARSNDINGIGQYGIVSLSGTGSPIELSISGSNYFTIPSGYSYYINIDILGMDQASGTNGNSRCWNGKGIIKNYGGTTVIDGGSLITMTPISGSATGYSASVVANNANDRLQVTCTGSGSPTWFARVEYIRLSGINTI